jgi:cysteine protease ATG4
MISLDQIYLHTRTMPNTLNRQRIYDAEDISHVASDLEFDESSPTPASSKLSRSRSETTLMLAEEGSGEEVKGGLELLNLVEEVPFSFGLYFRLAGMCETVRLCYYESLKLDRIISATYMENMGVFGRLDRVDQAHSYSTREVHVKNGYRHQINKAKEAQLIISIRTEEGVELFFRCLDLKVFGRSDIEKVELGELIAAEPSSRGSIEPPCSNYSHSSSFHSDLSRESLSLDSFVDLKHELNQITGSCSNSSATPKPPNNLSRISSPKNVGGDTDPPPNPQLRPNVFQQVGYENGFTTDLLTIFRYWLYGTKLGQYVANPRSNRPEKTSYATVPIWMLGVKYDLKSTNLDSFTPSHIKASCSPFHFTLKRRPYSPLTTDLYWRKDVFLIPQELSTIAFESIKSWVGSDGWHCSDEIQAASKIFIASTPGGNKICLWLSPYDHQSALFEAYITIQEHLQPCKAFFAQLLHRLNEICKPTKAACRIFQEWACASVDRSLHPPESDVATIAFDWNRRIEATGLTKYEGWCYFWDSSFGDWVWCFYEISAYGTLRIYNGAYLGATIKVDEASIRNESALIWVTLPNGQEHFIRLSAIHEASMLASRLYQLAPPSSEGKGSPASLRRTVSAAESFRKSYEHMRIQTALERKAEVKRRKDKNAELLEEFLLDFSARFWFTYRRDMPRLVGATLINTDAGWGCMLRCGQMMIAETYARILFGRGWNKIHLECGGISPSSYTAVVGLFEDALVPTAPYGIHSLVAAGTAFGHPIGHWFSPTLLTHVLRAQSLKTSPMHFIVEEITNGCIQRGAILCSLRSCSVLLLAPMRLGVEGFNHECYKDLVTGALELKQSVGIIGGLPGKSFHIVAHQGGQELFYLDPHEVRGPAPSPSETFLTDEYHTRIVMTMSPANLDPSMIFGFLVRDFDDLEALLKALSRLNQRAPVFSFLP